VAPRIGERLQADFTIDHPADPQPPLGQVLELTERQHGADAAARGVEAVGPVEWEEPISP